VQSIYTTQLKYTDSDDTVQGVLAILDHLGIQSWLVQHPFYQLEFSDVVQLGPRQVNGWYSYRDKSAHIALSRSQDTYGTKLDWGRNKALSHVSSTELEAVQKTLIHELGHHLHQRLSEVDLLRYNLTFRVIRSNAASEYAKTPFNPEEYFAETFVAWVFHRTDLIIFDELGYAMMKTALSILSVEVKEL
jgi:hypothetical protein